MKEDNALLTSCIYFKSPEAVLNELLFIAKSINSEINTDFLKKTFIDVADIFEGKYPGFKKCNTEYHNFKHTTDVLIAAARLIHGAYIEGIILQKDSVEAALVAAMFHDVGYIQSEDDNVGSGAKYTLYHVERGISFLNNYGKIKNLDKDFITNASNIIAATELEKNISAIPFNSKEIEMLAKIVATADLIGQMTDRAYLEKLLFLFYELKEGGISIESELQLLKNTLDFFNKMEKRLEIELGGVSKYMKTHLKKRYGIDRDVYHEGFLKNIEYLSFILQNHEKEYRKFLRRT